MTTGNIQDNPYIKSKLRVYLYGNACANILVHFMEHLTLEQIKEKYGEWGISKFPPDSPWTELP